MKKLGLIGLFILFILVSIFYAKNTGAREYLNLADFKRDLSNDLAEKNPNAEIINFETSRPVLEELTKIEKFLPHYDDYDFDEIETLYSYAKNCVDVPPFKKSPFLKKAWLWQEYLCKKQKLPEDFFNLPPYIHPSGQSYSWLGRQKGLKVPGEFQTWAENIYSEKEPKYFQNSDWPNLVHVDAQVPVIYLEKFVLVKVDRERSNYVYKVYPIADAIKFQKDKPYLFVLNNEKTANLNCMEPTQTGCWAFRTDYVPLKNRIILRVLFAVTALMGIALLLFWFMSWRKEQQHYKDKNFIVRTLAHELRTPIASLSLDIESLRKSFDHLDKETQKGLLRVFSGVERLRTLVQKSEHYLSTGIKSRKKEAREKINLKDFVSHLLESGEFKNITVNMTDDLKIEVHPYWLKLALENLILNATIHGKPPIVVSAEMSSGYLHLDISDQGEIKSDLKSLSKSYIKSNESKGLGLGLEIARKSAALTDAELKLIKSPHTTFRLTWRI